MVERSTPLKKNQSKPRTRFQAIKPYLVTSALAIWALAAIGMIASQKAQHLAEFRLEPNQLALDSFAEKLSANHPFHQPLLVIHNLIAPCSCTGPLVQQIAQERRNAMSAYDEVAITVNLSSDNKSLLKSAGIALSDKPRAFYSNTLNMHGAPFLLVYDRTQRRLVYQGGYFEKPFDYQSEHSKILQDLASGKSPTPRPIYGCPTSDELAEAMDFTGLNRAIESIAE